MSEKLKEYEESEGRKKSWQDFLSDRLEIKPGEEKYIASCFSLRDMWTSHAHGYGSALDHANERITNLRAALEELNIPYQAYTPAKMPRLPHIIIAEAIAADDKARGE